MGSSNITIYMRTRTYRAATRASAQRTATREGASDGVGGPWCARRSERNEDVCVGRRCDLRLCMALPAWHGLGEGMSRHKISRMQKNTGLRACHNGRSAQALASPPRARGPRTGGAATVARAPAAAPPPGSLRPRARAHADAARRGHRARAARRAAFSRARPGKCAGAGDGRRDADAPRVGRRRAARRRRRARPAAAATGHGLPRRRARRCRARYNVGRLQRAE